MLKILIPLAVLVPMTARAQYYYAPNPYAAAFDYGYRQATGTLYGAPAPNWGQTLAQLNSTEALINEMRAARGVPPCAIGILKQAVTHRPAC